MGKIPLEKPQSLSMISVSLFVNNASITNLWELDVLGINDPAERMTREETALAAKEFFLETITIDVDGRYEVRLPWLEGHPALPSNYQMAKKRLENTVKKVINDGYFEAYDQVFRDWLYENIIEEVFEIQPTKVAHYLPHRQVIKPSSAITKIKPVFDASARERDSPSLNQCLEKGLNLIELISGILLRFRRQRIGVVSDIRKAFLQISIHEADRDFLRFLWSDSEGKQIVYRHRRVVFGINSSPFLLGATIEYHLSKMLKESDSKPFSKDTIMKLSDGFYVDNCVTSVANDKELRTFVEEASIVMAEGKFDLRGWVHTYQVQDGNLDISTSVLGMKWNKENDTLSLNQDDNTTEQFENKLVTKRFMLSQAQRVFDPIGYTCPTTLIPKLLLQKTWEKQLTWDTPVDPIIETHFRMWMKELPYLSAIRIPRWIHAGSAEADQWALHTFCDASKEAFAVVVFLRGVQNGEVFVHLLAAKAKVAPLKTWSISRLELMAAIIAVRLYTMCRKNLNSELESFFWSDSTTVLSWIRRPEEWSTFVWNRVKEIRTASSDKNWHHVPGTLNPADLPSRGCSAKQLLESTWWEGPSWLYRDSSCWPRDNLHYDEEEINKEKKKKLVTVLLNSESKIMTLENWHLYYFSQYLKTLRMCAWILRFIHNSRNKYDKHKGDLSAEECDKSELLVLKLIQQESFANENDKKLRGLNGFKDKNGLIRLKTRISNREDHENFRYPIVLPAKHSVVNRLIFGEHVKLCHVGAQGLMSILRERHWILGGRRAIKSAISGFVVCKRHNAKPFDASSPPLPMDRIRDAVVFEITGVDFAGPLYLKTGEKVWVCLFTCAVYRAVHLELCRSLSTADFMQALRRFIARRGRPKTIYSDNGTNFVGTENAFSLVDFQKIAEHSSAERIRWRFNPPTAAWWGGFWERLVGVLKQLLRKMLGRSSLDYESLATVLCDCESVINSRPLTCPSSDANELVPLTPVMFLRDQVPGDVPDCDAVDQQSLSRKVLHRQKLLEDLRRKFRNEYLGQLKWWSKRNKESQVKVGEVVFVSNDKDKRANWPLGRVIELLPGNDGRVRLVKVLTERGQFLRPIQRLYPLECAADYSQMENGGSSDFFMGSEPLSRNESASAESGVTKSRVPESEVRVTRSGRNVKTPVRYSDCQYY
ncbi:uncharacterized protein LOC108904648 [Anoplophora glabripennis]|uniref:uncharacterized protein LOC108904648 n=1 Tax=Anoplophora glabripennis TaxID=217634 RepID=UPI000C77515C|nr:uncharacterized protein LOC108904648 [Anoplophora glabripennis]